VCLKEFGTHKIGDPSDQHRYDSTEEPVGGKRGKVMSETAKPSPWEVFKKVIYRV